MGMCAELCAHNHSINREDQVQVFIVLWPQSMSSPNKNIIFQNSNSLYHGYKECYSCSLLGHEKSMI